MKERLTDRDNRGRFYDSKGKALPKDCIDYNNACDLSGCGGDMFDIIVSRLAELEDKFENGTLIELPCGLGETVYHIKTKAEIDELEIVKTTLSGYTNLGDGIGLRLWLESFNVPVLAETVFITREEAEKRLKELQGEQK